MWWKTTEVYRVPLPFSGIRYLSDEPIKIIRKVGLYSKDPDRAKLLIQELERQFTDEMSELNFFQISLPKHVVEDIPSISSLEKMILEHGKLSDNDRAVVEFDQLNTDVLIKSNRLLLFSKDSTSIAIERIIRKWMFGRNDNNIAPYPEYEVVISILNPRPDIQNIQWDVRSAIKTYLRPFVNTITTLSNFTIKSQWKYQVGIEFPSKQKRDNSTFGRHYSLSDQYLPHIITSIEKSLGNSIHDNPCINLVIYVPPCESSPLYIYNSLDQRVTTNDIDSFVSIKWGGIVFANPKETDCKQFFDNPNEKIDMTIDSEKVMPILLQKIKRIIGIDSVIGKTEIYQPETIEDIEVERYFTYGSVFLINKATSTLQSLIQLLANINNIVINDEVGIAVNEAYQHIIDSKNCLRNNDILNATKHARKAFIQSEKAFYYPSMLALLYFPDDQKYAIYIPLFLPITIPVILSMKTIWIFYKKNKLKPKTE